MEVETARPAHPGGGGGHLDAAGMQAKLEQLAAEGSAALAKEHGYSRSDPVTGVALSEADEWTLHRLLLERLFAKKLRNFESADQLRQTLIESGSKGLEKGPSPENRSKEAEAAMAAETKRALDDQKVAMERVMAAEAGRLISAAATLYKIKILVEEIFEANFDKSL